jgi:Zinc finger, C2H2 type
MEKVLTYSIDNCFVCSEYMEIRNELTIATGYSEKTIYEIFGKEKFSNEALVSKRKFNFSEEFTNVSFTSEILEEAGICSMCYVKFNEYAEHKTIAEQIQAELVSLFDASNSDDIKQIPEVKLEHEVFDETTLMYEALEEDQHEPVDDIFMTSQDEEAINEGDPIIVEYGWLEDNVQPEKHFEMLPPKPKLERPRKNKFQDNATVILMDDNMKLYQCDVCMRTFRERSKLKSHREIHTDQRNVICPTCGKAFKTQACLRSHRRVHNPSYMYCDICGKSYTQKPELAKHIKFVHFHIREHFCETCGAGFGSKGHLSTHMLIHQSAHVMKANVCQVCTLSFHTRAKLERHMVKRLL